MGNPLSIARYRCFVVLKPIPVKLCIGLPVICRLAPRLCLWKNLSLSSFLHRAVDFFRPSPTSWKNRLTFVE